MIRPLTLLSIFSLLLSISLPAQEKRERELELNSGAEIVSSYIWRGQNYSHTPSLQPWAELSWRGFTFGTWGAFRITGQGDDEINFYISKETGPLTIAIWDYWSYSKTNPSQYFNYEPATTSHMFEGQAMLSFGEENRFNFLFSSIFYGSDPSKSIYGEAEYVKSFGRNQISLFTGYQFKGEYYASSAGFVNLGCSYLRHLPLNEKLASYISLSFIVNPSASSTYFIVAVGI
ncbi:MAG: hypothetical protein CVU13_05700 [Bacteroidetes bacterium HGW-Bacteroidetes-8]|jgi:hypothetical protein|nr:MAG: hypothetical protein CVU13_05700 [Bacteroidetes bacterium HGW-Bacteroidetes-8]